MGYFKKANSMEDLKQQYRELAMQNHPDVGGNNDIMKAINLEFDMLYNILKKVRNVVDSEEPFVVRNEFYTQNGWKGANYKSSVSTKEIAKIIRNYCKIVHNDYRFSVTCKFYSGGSSISISMTEAPEKVFLQEELHSELQLNHYYLENETRITEEAKKVMTDINRLVSSYRYDDSDSMIDYFSTNFYYHLAIGQWNKPLEIVPRNKKILR